MTERSGAHVVVGGASGIGAAVAEAERDAGTDVLVLDVAGSFDVECDVTDDKSVVHAVDTMEGPSRGRGDAHATPKCWRTAV